MTQKRARDPNMLSAFNKSVGDKSLMVKPTEEEKAAQKDENLRFKFSGMSDDDLRNHISLAYTELRGRQKRDSNEVSTKFDNLLGMNSDEYVDSTTQEARNHVLRTISNMHASPSSPIAKADKKMLFRLTADAKKIVCAQAHAQGIPISEYIVESLNYKMLIDEVEDDDGNQIVLRVPRSGDHMKAMYAKNK